jgi:hypothetical protein
MSVDDKTDPVDPVDPVDQKKKVIESLDDKLSMVELRDRLDKMEAAEKAREQREIDAIVAKVAMNDDEKALFTKLVTGKKADEAKSVLDAIQTIVKARAPAPTGSIPVGTNGGMSSPGRYQQGYDHAAFLKSSGFLK